MRVPSDEDAPFVVPARPSRRLVLVAESAEATPQSIQDREVGTSFPLSARGPDFCSGTAPTPVSLSNRFTVLDESAADVHVMTDGSVGTQDSASPIEFGVEQHAREPEAVPSNVSPCTLSATFRSATRAVGMACLDMVDMREAAACSGDADRASVSQKCIQGSIPGCFGRKTFGRSKRGFHQGPAGMEVHASTQNDLVSTTSRRQSPPEAVGRTVPSIRRGDWVHLLRQSMQAAEQGSVNACRRRRQQRGDDVNRRAARALRLVQLGKASSARQALKEQRWHLALRIL